MKNHNEQDKNNKIVVLISGSGSNLQALIDYQAQLGYTIKAVISNSAAAFGLQRAQEANITTAVIDHNTYVNRAVFERELQEKIESFSPSLVVLAGFMRILGASFTTHFEGRMLNVHPSLLPKYKGLHTHEKVLKAGDLTHGATVHFVTAELDGGPLVVQAPVTVLPSDTPESLGKRVLKQEHCIYPLAVAWFILGRLKMRTHMAYLDNTPLPPQGYQFLEDDKALQSLAASV